MFFCCHFLLALQVAYAKHDNAMAFLKFFLAMTNKKIIDDMHSKAAAATQQG